MTRGARLATLAALILTWVALPTSAFAQNIVCCNQLIGVNGPWIGMDRSGNSSCIEQAQGSRKMQRRICRGGPPPARGRAAAAARFPARTRRQKIRSGPGRLREVNP